MAPPLEAKVFVKGLPPDIKEKDVKYIFSRYGTLISTEIVMWPTAPILGSNGCLTPVEVSLTSRRERPNWHACAFITYGTADTAATAIRALHNVYRVHGGSEPISVCMVRSGALPEPVQATATASTAAPSQESLGGFSGGASATASYVAEKTRCKLFVGNLQGTLSKEAIAAAFSEFGKVVNAHVMTGKSKFGSACAFIEFSNPQEADLALRAMHQKFEPRIGSGTAPITVTYFQSQSSGKAGQAVSTSTSGSSRYNPF